VKLRSVSAPYKATLEHMDNGVTKLTLDQPQYGISPGQAATCYIDSRVIGGGWITSTGLISDHQNLAA
jgi:tRNA-specific 2-thiouridylase